MHLNNSVDLHESAPPVADGGLAEGFMLLRASTLKMLRLQLAIERQDRHRALEAVDDLVALDRRLQDYLDSAPASAEQLMLRRELESDRAALNQERLALTAGVIRRQDDASGQRDAVDQTVAIEPEDGRSGLHDLQFEPEKRRRSGWWLVLALIIVAAVAAAAYFATAGEIPAWLAQTVRAVR
jgi:hypothetical protein